MSESERESLIEKIVARGLNAMTHADLVEFFKNTQREWLKQEDDERLAEIAAS